MLSMKLKTSTKISLKFTLFASIILFIFSFVIFILFFSTRYSKQKARLSMNADYEPPLLLEFVQLSPMGVIKRQNVKISPSEQESISSSGDAVFTISSQALPSENLHVEVDTKPRHLVWDSYSLTLTPIRSSLSNFYSIENGRHSFKRRPQNFFASQEMVSIFHELPIGDFSSENGYYTWDSLSHFSRGNISIFLKDDKYFLYTIERDTVRFIDITWFFYSQLELIQILLLWDCFFLVIVYLVSLYFVKSSLKNLKKVTRFAQNLDFNNLSSSLDIRGHKYDEIKVIADAFNSSLQKINSQIISLKDFIANASHELKTPLMMINSEIDIALKKKDYEERLLNIKHSVKRLSDLLENLSLITRLESTFTIQKESVDLKSLVQEVIQILKKKYPKKNINFSIPKDYSVSSHPILLEIVIRNLLENACKYAGEWSHISFIAHDKWFLVQDDGVWIDSEYQEKIFERFWQMEKIEQEGYSFGLWLYLVKKIVDLHGWDISVTSEIGKGSIFSISFTP